MPFSLLLPLCQQCRVLSVHEFESIEPRNCVESAMASKYAKVRRQWSRRRRNDKSFAKKGDATERRPTVKQ